MKLSDPTAMLETEQTQLEPQGSPVEIVRLREQIAIEVGSGALCVVKSAIADVEKVTTWP